MSTASARLVDDWKSQGTPLEVPGANSMIWRMGEGVPVVCLHGVPASGFLYRKVLAELAARGLQGVTFDFPGLGFADRPEDFDYSWTGLARWTERALEAAGIDKFHLVVHDIGGPIGFEVVANNPDRILSLTVLNTVVDVATFRRPWLMEPYAWPLLDRLWLAPMNSPMVHAVMRHAGMQQPITYAETRAYGTLLTLQDRGRAFLKIMKGFERTEAYEARIKAALRDRAFPAQVVWSRSDPALSAAHYAPKACAALGLEGWDTVEGKHFPQENSPGPIADKIAELAAQVPVAAAETQTAGT